MGYGLADGIALDVAIELGAACHDLERAIGQRPLQCFGFSPRRRQPGFELVARRQYRNRRR